MTSRARHSAPARGDAPLAFAIGVLAFAMAMITLHVVTARIGIGTWWGAHLWAFMPPWSLWGAVVLALAAAVPLTRWIVVRARNQPETEGEVVTRAFGSSDQVEPGKDAAPIGAPTGRLRSIAWGALAALAAAAVFWMVRSRNVLLGDGIAILSGTPGAGGLHELEPLTMLVQAKAFQLCSAVLSSTHSAREITRLSVAMVSVLAGALFVPVAWALAGEVEATARALGRGDTSGSGALERGTRPLMFAVLMSQGYLLLFCGYVENYAPLALAFALVLLTGLRCARGSGSLFAVGAAVLLGVALHLSGAALLPAWAGLALWSLSRAQNRRRVAIEIGLTIVLAALLCVALAWLQPGYNFLRTIWDVTLRAVGQKQEDPTYLISLRHARDVLNEQVLIGPLGMFVFVAGSVAALASGAMRSAPALFLTMAGLGCAGACLVAGDSNLGYARNWDLLAPSGVVLTAAGLFLLRCSVRSSRLWPRALLMCAAVSMFHTLPWITLNMSEAQALERFKTLPLGNGRSENTVAFWYAEHGDVREAKRWIQKSLAIDPHNNRAADLLGRIAFEQNDARLALHAYFVAVTLRPDKPDYRQQLAQAVAGYGGPERALGALDTLMQQNPEHGALWFERAMLLRASGRAAEAHQARARAIALIPGLAPFPDSLPRLTLDIASAEN